MGWCGCRTSTVPGTGGLPGGYNRPVVMRTAARVPILYVNRMITTTTSMTSPMASLVFQLNPSNRSIRTSASRLRYAGIPALLPEQSYNDIHATDGECISLPEPGSGEGLGGDRQAVVVAPARRDGGYTQGTGPGQG